MQRRILIIDDHDDLATALEEVFTHVGHEVKVIEERSDALAMDNLETFDLVITDLDVERTGPLASLNGNAPNCLPVVPGIESVERIKAFKLFAANFRRDDFDLLVESSREPPVSSSRSGEIEAAIATYFDGVPGNAGGDEVPPNAQQLPSMKAVNP